VRFLLDTNAVIALLRRDPNLEARLRQHKPTDFGLPAIVTYELYFGAFKGQRRDENVARIDALQFQVLEFDQEDARASGRVRAELEAIGKPIGPYDLLIAGQALARDLILISRNLSEFGRLRELRAEDWES
jgi:tRNA(fMet)-specific endonuclease VapC